MGVTKHTEEREEIITLGKQVALIMEKHESPLTGELRREMALWERLTAAAGSDGETETEKETT